MEYPYFKGLEADRYSFYRVPKALVKADLFQKMSGDGKTFNHLMEIIESEENIKLAYRTIKKNHGSKTPGVDKKTIRNLAKLSEDEYVRLVRRNSVITILAQ